MTQQKANIENLETLAHSTTDTKADSIATSLLLHQLQQQIDLLWQWALTQGFKG